MTHLIAGYIVDGVPVQKGNFRLYMEDYQPFTVRTYAEVAALNLAGQKSLLVGGFHWVVDPADTTSAHDPEAGILKSLDNVRFKPATRAGAGGGPGLLIIAAPTFTAQAAHDGFTLIVTQTCTVSFDAAATLKQGWGISVRAAGGNVTLDPNASEQIDDLATLVIQDGFGIDIACTGVAFYSIGRNADSVGTSADPLNLRATAIQASAALGSLVELPNGVADGFGDQTGVDDATSTNEEFIAGRYQPTVVLSADQVPQMTSNTTPSGTVTATSNVSTLNPWEAFDNDTGGWLSNGLPSGGSPQRLGYQFTAAKEIVGYTLQVGLEADIAGAQARMANSWTFEGSNDGSAWDVLDTRSGETAWAADEVRSYTVANPGSYTHYRWSFTANNGGSTGVGLREAEMKIVGSIDNMTLVSETFTANAQPSAAAVMIDAYSSAAYTINTDLTVEVSRDGGTTWTAATLALLRSKISGEKTFGATAVSLGAQPAGTSMKWRVKTLNNKSIEVRGISVEWSV